MSRTILWIISLYQQWISPFLGPHCRFEPSCSHYGHEAIRRHGLLRGLGLTILRLLKCQPFHAGGSDPVP